MTKFQKHFILLHSKNLINMAYNNIIGRNEEIKSLERFYKSSKSEFIAIYGRRRVGKSYLVEEVYKDKIAFRAIGAFIKDKEKCLLTTQLPLMSRQLPKHAKPTMGVYLKTKVIDALW